MSHFYKYAELNGINRNITASIPSPKNVMDARHDHVVDVWNDADLKTVINALSGTTMRFIVVLAVNTGARISELLALDYNDICSGSLYINKQLSERDINGTSAAPHIVQTKTATSNRIIPLSDAVLREFDTHILLHKKEMLKNGYRTSNIFTTGSGSYYYRRNITRSLERLYKRLGIQYHKFHAFRHTFGTNLSRAGVPIEETSKLMGHSDINVTMKYYINIDAARKRAAIEKIAGFSL